VVIYYGIYDIYCVNLIRNEQELLAILKVLRYTSRGISVNREYENIYLIVGIVEFFELRV